MTKSILGQMMYAVRDWRSRPLFIALETYSRGRVLDIGGWDFYISALRRSISHESWTCVEVDSARALDVSEPRFQMVYGDGCDLPFEDSSYDVALSIQVLEHVFEPHRMVLEMSRVLKPGGHAIILAPQTGNIHLVPHHYANLTAFWLRESLHRAGFEILELRPLGGAWSTLASRLVYFVLQSIRTPTTTYESRRPLGFYLLLPFSFITATICLPWFLLLGLWDMEEEANNHLAVAVKRGPSKCKASESPKNPLV